MRADPGSGADLCHALPVGAPSKHWWILLAWQGFAGGLFALGLVDHWLRMRDGDVRGGGIGGLQSPIVVVLGVVAASLVWRGTSGLATPWRVVLLAIQLLLGFALYAAAAVAYVCGTGIDCF